MKSKFIQTVMAQAFAKFTQMYRTDSTSLCRLQIVIARSLRDILCQSRQKRPSDKRCVKNVL